MRLGRRGSPVVGSCRCSASASKSRCPPGASKPEEPHEARGAGATAAAVWGPLSHQGPSTLRRGGLGGAGIPGRGLKCGEERATAISSDLASAEAKKDRAHTDQGSRWGPAGALGRRHRKPKGVSLAGPRGPRGGQRQRKAGGRGGIGGSSEIFIRQKFSPEAFGRPSTSQVA